MKKTDDFSASINVLSEAVRVNGSFTSDKNVRVIGTIDGDVHVDGLLIIDQKGFINGNIYAKKIEVAGKVTGVLRTDGKLTIKETAIIIGDIYTKSLQIEEHAIVEGEFHMEKETPAVKVEAENEEKTEKVVEADVSY